MKNLFLLTLLGIFASTATFAEEEGACFEEYEADAKTALAEGSSVGAVGLTSFYVSSNAAVPAVGSALGTSLTALAGGAIYHALELRRTMNLFNQSAIGDGPLIRELSTYMNMDIAIVAEGVVTSMVDGSFCTEEGKVIELEDISEIVENNIK